MRGNLTLGSIYLCMIGSIPACAGEPRPPVRQNGAPKVYPRVCGGTWGKSTTICGIFGLSPRVRGNLHVKPTAKLELRSIPACAGEPRPAPPLTDRRRVYPRVCGGTDTISVRPCAKCGLSPRVRGNPSNRRAIESILRSIPACAGEPVPEGQHDEHVEVYPRVCGGT